MASLADWTKREPWAIPMGEQVSVEAELRKHGAEIGVEDDPPAGATLESAIAAIRAGAPITDCPHWVLDEPCCGDPGDYTESCP